MAVPVDRASFKEYCLRKLGKPVIEINVDDDQVEDRIDEALRYYWDYHFDGTEKIYYKHQITGAESPGALQSVTINSPGTGYSNSDVVTIVGSGTEANVALVTYANGTIQSVVVSSYGKKYANTDTVSIATSGGSGANLSVVPGGGYITLPENIIGTVRVFPIGDPSIRSDDMFNIRYQIALNDLYSLTAYSMIPYYMAMQHLALISEMLVGQQPIRFSRHRNRLYVDTKWTNFNAGEYLVVEAYEVLNPDTFADVWSDRWLQNYCTAKIKYQWGSNLTKFSNMQLPGGVQFNGEKIYDDAKNELEKMEEEMILNYSLPVSDMIG